MRIKRTILEIHSFTLSFFMMDHKTEGLFYDFIQIGLVKKYFIYLHV